MVAVERKKRMMEIVQERGAVSVHQLAEALEVSDMTIRRDLVEVKKTGAVEMTSGVVFYRGMGGSILYNLHFAQGANAAGKDRIGKAAAALVKPGDVIFIDIGTTSVCVVKHLPDDIDITAVCFTLNALAELQQKNVGNLIISGGFYHKDTQTFECREAMDMLQDNIRANKVFLSAAGASMNMGLTCVNQYETMAKRTSINCSEERILLIDHSKFGRLNPVCFAGWDVIDTVITDLPLSEEWRAFFAEKGIKVIVADAEE